MTKEELILNIQQTWRWDDHRSAEMKRKDTENLIDEYLIFINSTSNEVLTLSNNEGKEKEIICKLKCEEECDCPYMYNSEVKCQY
jgi:hypothetical protein